ncbi:MAG: SulP family inorganic anion transporter, partial [Candidatus Melainabacteria bacterium]|nr:SulP family inorganic anion transporter [Candidatus Melainabacteria bacterium]
MKYFARNKTTFKQEGLAAVVVFLVALPLSLGIAVATGASPTAGIISAAIGGIIVGSFAGCPLQVSGPAAGLITIVAEIIHKFGLEQLGLIVFLAGIIQLIFAALRLGPVFRAVAPSVIQGMLSAIGVSIFASQFHVMVGDSPNHGPIENLLLIPNSLIQGLFPMDGSIYHMSALIGVVTIAVIVIWNFVPKSVKAIPPALIGVVVSVLISRLFQLPIKHLVLPDNVIQDLNIVDWGVVIPSFTDSPLMIAAFTVAFVATAETLLTATAVDQLHSGERTKYNKEIFAQGLGNLFAGFLGVLPISGVIVRSAANVSTGAKTRVSTILHGVLLVVFILIFPHVLEMIPTSCLAAILVYTGVKLVNYKAVFNIYSYRRAEFIIYLIT